MSEYDVRSSNRRTAVDKWKRAAKAREELAKLNHPGKLVAQKNSSVPSHWERLREALKNVARDRYWPTGRGEAPGRSLDTICANLIEWYRARIGEAMNGSAASRCMLNTRLNREQYGENNSVIMVSVGAARTLHRYGLSPVQSAATSGRWLIIDTVAGVTPDRHCDGTILTLRVIAMSCGGRGYHKHVEPGRHSVTLVWAADAKAGLKPFVTTQEPALAALTAVRRLAKQVMRSLAQPGD